VKIELKCPVCHSTFVHDEVAAPDFGVEGESSDLRQIGDVCPLETAYLASCPSCLYTYLSVLWLDKVSEEARIRIKSEQEHLLGRDPAIPSDRFWVAARCAELQGSPPFVIGYLHLMGSWVSRSVGDESAEGAHQEAAIEAFEAALDDPELDPDDRANALYLLGEINRRLACFGAAIGYFDRLLATEPTSAAAERAPELKQLAEECNAEDIVWNYPTIAEDV
jgi:tetratricopeptide (TPR) repeat protein